MLLVGWGCGGVEPIPAGGDLLRLLPAASSFEGWQVAEGPTGYVPDDLYEYLDGGAERYITHGFRRLVHVRYQLGDDLLAGVTLDVFDMGGDLGAFGIYRSGLPPEPGLRAWGTEGHRTATVAAAWKGSIFVHGVADDDRAELIEMLERLVAGICNAVPGEASFPAILGALPPEGLVPRSERHVAADLLGHAFLPGGVLATYALEGGEGQLYFSDLGGEAAVAGALARLRAHHARWGAILGEVDSIGAGGFRYSEPGRGSGIVVGAGRFVAGVHGDLPPEAQDRLLGELAGNLGSPSMN
jgi:hypothetical protein